MQRTYTFDKRKWSAEKKGDGNGVGNKSIALEDDADWRLAFENEVSRESHQPYSYKKRPQIPPFKWRKIISFSKLSEHVTMTLTVIS